MEIKKGDKVRFLNTTGGGVVTRVEGRLAFVDDEDGFEIPVLLSELVLVEKDIVKSDTVKATDKKEEPEDVNQIDNYEYVEVEGGDDNPEFYLAFLRGDAPGVESGSVRGYLINDSNYFCYYLLNETGVNGKTINLYNGVIEPNTKIELDKHLITSLDGVKWEIQLLFYKPKKTFIPLPPANVTIVLKGSKLMNEKSYKENDYFNEKAYLHAVLKGELEKRIENLTDKEFEQIKSEKSGVGNFNKRKRRDEPGILEVDLHIHELLDDTRGLSNSEMLEIQMNKFHQVMKENLKNKKRKIVFIHGVGNGVLKSEIRKALDRKYKDHYYQDASFSEYGYGATMVVI
ncbi:MAG: DUF2027 domain-containing protein [Chlorobi bacterium]|nr:DUF2027 domain-containing protein [Chlorobiota bacterium]